MEPRKFVGRKSRPKSSNNSLTTRTPRLPKFLANQIPDDILHDEALNEAISSLLPTNYDFEIHKCIHNIRRYKHTRVGLQMPEGLLIFACVIADIIERFARPDAEVTCVIMGDVTYGACCIDDYTALALGCDILIHYAHSCLVPVDVTQLRVLYVFVTIAIDESHLRKTLVANFAPGSTIVLVGTIQFNAAIHAARAAADADKSSPITLLVPQSSPLSRGEILGCTAPHINPNSTTAIVYVGDGRFHLEAAMIQNPGVPAYRYDPYSRKFTRETYAHSEMLSIRQDAIATAKKATHVGLILGTLGRQGNYNTFDRIRADLDALKIDYTLILLSEIFPQKLAQFQHIDAFVQVACPRLSIDWGYAFPKPLLTPYEASIAFGSQQPWSDLDMVISQDAPGYKMDYYAKDGFGRSKPLTVL
ncbi:putative diphthamide synthesis protein-domain-containing protein [Lipomyces arxii]|uniref:putative diphthamide synthesis protein-domain-containing protein n=1 Tax=Lipomyces arxii TaxID=56418 RepID=UPI0034CFC812